MWKRERVSEREKLGKGRGVQSVQGKHKKGGKLIISANGFHRNRVFSSTHVFYMAPHVLTMHSTLSAAQCVYVQTCSLADHHAVLCFKVANYRGGY